MPTNPYDEEAINAEDTIIRRINPLHHIIWDENRQRNRISSKAYNKSSLPTGGMSVDIEALMLAAGVKPESFVTTPVFTGSVAFPARAIRALDLWIGYCPIQDDPKVRDNPFHGEVWAKTPKKSFSEAEKSGLAKQAHWYVRLDEVDLL